MILKFEDSLQEFDAGECQQKGGRQRLLLDIDITFSDSRRGNRGGRGGRPSRPGGLNSTPSSKFCPV